MPLPCCSLVKKDAHMLDAFGKGASDDIRSAKEELYNQVGAAAQALLMHVKVFRCAWCCCVSNSHHLLVALQCHVACCAMHRVHRSTAHSWTLNVPCAL
jgi:hypothetical protein